MAVVKNLSIEDFDDIVFGDHIEYETVVKQSITGSSRWHTFYDMVCKNKLDNTYWRIEWKQGSTEMQDEGPEEISMVEVEPKEITTTVYVNKKSPAPKM